MTSAVTSHARLAWSVEAVPVAPGASAILCSLGSANESHDASRSLPEHVAASRASQERPQSEHSARRIVARIEALV